MSAGLSLRAAAYKIAQAVPGSDRTVSLYADVTASYDPSYQKKPAPTPTLLVAFGQACDVRNLSMQKATALLGAYEAGDLEFLLPAEIVTEAQLRTAKAYVQYGTDGLAETLTVMRVDPIEINFGVVATWRVVGRVRGKAVPT